MGIIFSSPRRDYLEPKNVDDQTWDLYQQNFQKAKDQMDAWERVAAIFETDINGDISPDLALIRDATLIATIMESSSGSPNKPMETRERFMAQNTHKKYKIPQKTMLGKLTLERGSGGAFRAGSRLLGLQFFIYTASTSIIAAYRGRHGILEHVGVGGAAGFLYGSKFGPKASMVGLVLVLEEAVWALRTFSVNSGASGGLCMAGPFYFLWKSPEELIQWHYNNIEARKRAEEVDLLKAARHKDTEDDLLKFHDP